MFHVSVPLLIGLLPLVWLALAVAVRPTPRRRQPVPIVVPSLPDRYTEAIRISPALGETYHVRGQALAARGDKAKAAEDFAKAKSLGYTP